MFIQESPDGLGWHDYYLSIGEYAAPYYPRNCRITIRTARPSGDISDFIGNSRGYFIASERLCDVLKSNCTGIEYLPVSLFSRDGRPIRRHYFFVNPIGALDCLNESQCHIQYDRRGDILRLERLVLDRDKVIGAPKLFRVFRKPIWYIFNNGELAEIFKKEGITNIIGERLPVL
jgi:hypothetical protein